MSLDPTTPVAVVSAFTAALAAKDIDTALQHVADDCEYTNVPLGTVRGPAAMRELLGAFFAPTLENAFVIHHLAAEGEVVFVARTDRHRLATGWVELPVAGVWVVRDGRITLWRDYFDGATLQRQWPVPLA